MKTSTTRRRSPEFFQRVAASLISRRLTVRRTASRGASKKCEALSALLDLIAGDMRDLPLKERLPFFLWSVEVVAETLAAMPRNAMRGRRTVASQAA